LAEEAEEAVIMERAVVVVNFDQTLRSRYPEYHQ
jgi:hypothetical protein